MSTHNPIVELIYDFDPVDETELEAFKEFVMPSIYNAVTVFKKAKLPKERAAAFLDKLNDISEISDLLGGPSN